MRILIDATERQVAKLDALAGRERRSRAAVIRSAIDDYIKRQERQAVEDGFGLWGRGADGLAYQQKVRSEW